MAFWANLQISLFTYYSKHLHDDTLFKFENFL